MERVLRTLELISHIFGCLYENDNAPPAKDLFSCALTCKAWCEPALDVLWKNLDSLVPLLALLAPLKGRKRIQDFNSLKFSRPIRLSDWSTFKRYSSRVRSLHLHSGPQKLISPDIFHEIAHKKQTFVLLPNLSCLDMALDVDGRDTVQPIIYSLLFTNESIREFRFALPHPSGFDFVKRAPEVFEEFAARMPNLTKLEVYSESAEWPISTIEKSVSKWVLNIPELVSFRCSDRFATPAIMSSLSKLPSLRAIEFSQDRGGHGCDEDFQTFKPHVAPGAFAALSTLEFCAKFDDAIAFLQMDLAPSLVSLSLYSPQLETAAALHHVFTGLSEARPSLKRLHLDSVHAVLRPLRNQNGQETDLITFETLEPVLTLGELIDFRVFYHRMFRLDSNSLTKLLACWERLECLCLCSDPILPETARFNPLVLPKIAHSCPRLRHLSFYLDTRNSSYYERRQLISFQSLEGINFGTSFIANESIGKLSSFLSRILPSTCNVDNLSNTNWTGGHYTAKFYAEYSGNQVRDRWGDVSRAVKMLIETRMEERGSYNELKMRYNDLEARYKELEAKYDKLLARHSKRRSSKHTP